MSNALDPSALDADRPFRPNLRRRTKSDLSVLVASKASFAIATHDKIIFGLMNARIQTQKDLCRFQVADEDEIVADNAYIAELIKRCDKGEKIMIEECVDFLDKVTDKSKRRMLVARICDLTTVFVRKHVKGERYTKVMQQKFEALQSYARQVRFDDDMERVEQLMTTAMVITKLKELLPGA